MTASLYGIRQIIGNAVPVKLAEFVARRIGEYLIDRETGGYYAGAWGTVSAQLELFEQKAVYPTGIGHDVEKVGSA